MSTFGYYNPELEIIIKYRVLTIEQSQEFVARYEDLPKNEYIYTVIQMCVLNVDSELKPALGALVPMQADHTLLAIYNGCVMLNPVLDIQSWSEILRSYNVFDKTLSQQSDFMPGLLVPISPEEYSYFEYDDGKDHPKKTAKLKKPFSMSKAKLNTLPKYMKGKVIGQDEPIDVIYKTLRRHQVGLADTHRPIGVFMFCGPSGVGKTFIAQTLHEYLYETETPLIRIDCGEFQHKHENQKLLGSPPGYTGYEDGGFLYKALQNSTGTVILLDEVEKAHHDFWDTFLKVFDEGTIVDSKGNELNFRNTIFIMTSNLGNEKVSATTYERQAGFTSTNITGNYDSKAIPKREMVERMTTEAIRKSFRPELLNRIDETIIFNHLSHEDFTSIANLEFQTINKKLNVRNFNLTWSPGASDLLVERSSKAMEGARGMAKVRRTALEDPLAELLSTSAWPKGKTFNVEASEGQFIIK